MPFWTDFAMEEVIQLVSGAKDRADTGDKVLALLPDILDAGVDPSLVGELVQGLQVWLKSSNTKVGEMMSVYSSGLFVSN